MKKTLLLFFCVALIFGCGKQSTKEKVAIKIGDIEVTVQEFEEAFKESPYAIQGVAGREAFLDRYITRKLVLSQAEKLGLDKDPEFLKSIQLFWEQSLLKRVFSEKTEDFSVKVRVGDDDIKAYYEKYKEKDFQGKELSEVYSQIKWIVMKQKQADAMEEWIESLKGKEKVILQKELLKISN